MNALVSVLENGKPYEYDGYKKYTNTSVKMGITQVRVNKLYKYNLIDVLGSGSFGMVFNADANDELNLIKLALK